MADSTKPLDPLRKSILASLAGDAPKPAATPPEAEEDRCAAFGFLRGAHERALAIEFRFRNGNRLWLPYSWLGPIYHDPSCGLLLRFCGDTLHVILIQGSNLDAAVRGGMNLMDRGLQRHRINFIREMDEDELRCTDKAEPTIDTIRWMEFDSFQEARDWLTRHAPAFTR